MPGIERFALEAKAGNLERKNVQNFCILHLLAFRRKVTSVLAACKPPTAPVLPQSPAARTVSTLSSPRLLDPLSTYDLGSETGKRKGLGLGEIGSVALAVQESEFMTIRK